MDKFLKKASEKLNLLDQSQTKQLFADLLETLELKDFILDSSPDGIILVGEERNIFYQNKVVSSIIAINYPRFYKFRDISSQIVDSDITDFLHDYWADPRKEKTISKEFTYQNGENVKIILVAVFNRFNTFHGHVCDMIRFSDITEKRIKENRLKRSESLAQMTTMTAGVAHEIKNPLGSISLYLQLLRRDFKKYQSLTREQAEKYLKVISEEIDRLNSIVVDFLFAVKPLSVNLRKEEVNNLVFDIGQFVLPELKENGIELELTLAPGLPKLMLDRSLFRQAALNVIKNSMQAIACSHADGKDGKIDIETKLNNDLVSVIFTDNGCGISEDKLSKIFEPYYTTKEIGTGLGLTVLFKIIKEHNGDLNVVSRENEGTTFVLSFPVPKDERMKIGYSGKVRYAK